MVVLIAVDHLSQETFEHYSDLFTGGFKWMIDNGIQFTETYHEHGYTATGPGHFVLGSGEHPGPAGMIGNSWFDRRTGYDRYCVEDSQAVSVGIHTDSRSYRQINSTAIGDWLKDVSPRSKVYSIAGKDRASILMGGKNPDLVLWYNWYGEFTTSSYYVNRIPRWLTTFNKSLKIASYRDSLWTHTLEEDTYLEYAREDFYYGESDNYLNTEYSPVLPIGFDSTYTDSMIWTYIGGTPWQERNTINLAKTIITKERLGKDRHPDILAIGLSATDWINHDYGPRSHEGMDNTLRLDMYLQDLLNTIDKRVGLDKTVFILTSDHGGLEIPEFVVEEFGKPAGRINREERDQAIQMAYAEIDSIYGDHEFIRNHGLGYYFNPKDVTDREIDTDLITAIIKEKLETVHGIRVVLTRDEILAATESDTLLMRMKHFTHPELSPDLWTIQEKHFVYRNPYGTSHGTPYDYDAHVPFLISHPSIQPHVSDERISAVDIAPTIADILGVQYPSSIDGKSKHNLLKIDKYASH